MSRLFYLISSHTKYEKICLPILLESLNSKDIIITVGGSGANRKLSKNGIDYYYATHNSFEYNSLINLLDLGIRPATHVFLLHDTMKCGPSFLKLSNEFERSYDVCSCSWSGFCNLAAYKVDYLYSIKKRLLNLRNCSKLQAIKNEGNFYLPCKIGHYSNCKTTTGEISRVYGGTLRTTVYYHAVDLWKYGANNGKTLKASEFPIDP